jgi:membrane-associated protease RseP (regulator of RpoE activity)
MSGPQGYGFSISTQPWLVHGLNHFITKVAAGSPAALAGLQPGDKILQLDDVTTSSLSHKIVAARMAAAADQRRPIGIVVSSDGPALDATSAFTIGDVVEAVDPTDGGWHDGTIAQINMSDGTVVVTFTGYVDTLPAGTLLGSLAHLTHLCRTPPVFLLLLVLVAPCVALTHCVRPLLPDHFRAFGLQKPRELCDAHG